MSLFAELKRRNVCRAAVFCAVDLRRRSLRERAQELLACAPLPTFIGGNWRYFAEPEAQ
jgi:hypothetical protein